MLFCSSARKKKFAENIVNCRPLSHFLLATRNLRRVSPTLPRHAGPTTEWDTTAADWQRPRRVFPCSATTCYPQCRVHSSDVARGKTRSGLPQGLMVMVCTDRDPAVMARVFGECPAGITRFSGSYSRTYTGGSWPHGSSPGSPGASARAPAYSCSPEHRGPDPPPVGECAPDPLRG